MKGRILRPILGILVFGSLLVLSTTAQEPVTTQDRKQPLSDVRTISSIPVPSGITDIGASTVDPVPSTIPVDVDFDLCFDVTVVSPDAEYVDRFEVDLPDYWTVHSVYPEAPNGCIVDTIAGTYGSNVIYWQIDGDIPSKCGPWYDVVQFCARIYVPGCLDDPWSLPWNITGDGYGDEPHSVTSTTEPLACVPAGLYLDGDNIYDTVCQGVTESYVLNLANHTGAEGTFSLQYGVTTGNGTISGPDQIYLGPGVDQDFQFDVTSQACLRLGELVEAAVIAEGNGFGDITYLHSSIKEDETCTPCESTYLPCILKAD